MSGTGIQPTDEGREKIMWGRIGTGQAWKDSIPLHSHSTGKS